MTAMKDAALPFRYLLRVRYGECDQQGVVYNARYGEYVDLACTEFLRAALAPANLFDGTIEFQVVKLLVEWTGPARFDDTLDITVGVKALGRTSVTLGFGLRRLDRQNLDDPQPLATAETVNVFIDPTTWTKAPLPDAFRTRLMNGARGQVIDHAGALVAKAER